MVDEKAVQVAWRLGRLRYKLLSRSMWLEDYDKFHAMAGGETYVLEVGRRTGKSSFDMLIGIEECIRTPRCIVGYIAPVREKLTEYIQPILFDVLQDCPDEFKPEYIQKTNSLVFKNGSRIMFTGSNNKSYVTLRGFKLKLLLGDEFAFVDNFNFALDQVLRPALFDSNGKILLSSTPSPQLDHPFHVLADKQKLKGLYKHGTIYDAGYDKAAIAKLREEDLSDEDFRRECLAERVTDPRRTIVPEWDAKYELPVIRDEFFTFYQYVCAMDLGWSDFTVVLWMYWDFKNAMLVVEDELVLRGPAMTTGWMMTELKAKEHDLFWENGREIKVPSQRVADVNNPLILSDISSVHGIHFFHPSKERKDVMVNQLRMLVKRGGVKVNPRCKFLLASLKMAMWTEDRSEFAESETLGHADAIDALIYGMRTINSQRNPIPFDYKLNPMTHYIPEEQVQTKDQNVFQKAFGLKPAKNPLWKFRSNPWK